MTKYLPSSNLEDNQITWSSFERCNVKYTKELLILAHMNIWSVFTWWGHCNPTGEWRVQAAYMWYFHFKQAIEILKSAAGPTGVLVPSVDIRSPTRWCRTTAYTSSEFPNQTIQISSYRHVFCVVTDLLSRSLKKKFQGWDFIASLFCFNLC